MAATKALMPGQYITFQPARGQRQSWVDSAAIVPAPKPGPPEVSLVDSLFHGGVAGATGSTLGLLDTFLPNGLDVGPVPLDGAAALGLYATAAAVNSPAALTAADSCTAVWSFRSTKKLLSVIDRQSSMAGEKVQETPQEPEKTSVDNDPICVAGKEIFSEKTAAE